MHSALAHRPAAPNTLVSGHARFVATNAKGHAHHNHGCGGVGNCNSCVGCIARRNQSPRASVVTRTSCSRASQGTCVPKTPIAQSSAFIARACPRTEIIPSCVVRLALVSLHCIPSASSRLVARTHKEPCFRHGLCDPNAGPPWKPAGVATRTSFGTAFGPLKPRSSATTYMGHTKKKPQVEQGIHELSEAVHTVARQAASSAKSGERSRSKRQALAQRKWLCALSPYKTDRKLLYYLLASNARVSPVLRSFLTPLLPQPTARDL